MGGCGGSKVTVVLCFCPNLKFCSFKLDLDQADKQRLIQIVWKCNPCKQTNPCLNVIPNNKCSPAVATSKLSIYESEGGGEGDICGYRGNMVSG